MAIVYGLVKDHGGYIDCERTSGQRTGFSIYLPAVALDAEKRENRNSAMQTPEGGNETILAVDDEEHLLDIVEEILTNFGYRVLTAPDGETALKHYRKAPDKIALVILDLIMPGMGGRRCLKQLRRINPAVRVIVSSGYPQEDERAELALLGAAGFIGKPYNLRDLLHAVRRVLDA